MNDAASTMDRIYGWQIGFYDVTRRFYLLGRDELIENLRPAQGAEVLEIGCGTGRNLIKAARRWPKADFHGIDISRVMLAKAGKAVTHTSHDIKLAQADATQFNPQTLFGKSRFQRIYFSYTLSMIPEWGRALAHATDMLAPGGTLLITDFADQSGYPDWFRSGLSFWLRLFHVTPRDDIELFLRRMAAANGMTLNFVPLYRGYAFLAALHRPL